MLQQAGTGTWTGTRTKTGTGTGTGTGTKTGIGTGRGRESGHLGAVTASNGPAGIVRPSGAGQVQSRASWRADPFMDSLTARTKHTQLDIKGRLRANVHSCTYRK